MIIIQVINTSTYSNLNTISVYLMKAVTHIVDKNKSNDI